MIRSKAYLVAVRDIPCQIESPVCEGRHADTCAAHSNQGEDGKGKGIKADDIMVAAACNSCHRWLDGSAPRAERYWYHDRGIKRTIREMAARGVIKVC